MSAYMVIRCRISDRAAFGAYGKAAAELVAKMGGRYVAAATKRLKRASASVT